MSQDPASTELPIQQQQTAFRQALVRGPVVVNAATGSGKSTLVPQWCKSKVLVVEPRRVACRSLARFVAQQQGTPLGERVGYTVRHDECAGQNTLIRYVTPGIALRFFQENQLQDYATVVLDEFHERSLELDLLLALLHKQLRQPQQDRCRLVVMSATLQTQQLVDYLDATAIENQGRQYAVDIEYSQQGNILPSAQQLAQRISQGVRAMAGHRGDMLVFLPGKAEIAAAAFELQSQFPELEIVPLHAQLGAREQDLAFSPARSRRVILATNVAETAVTLPRIGVVIDSGLVRQTQYRGHRGYLTLVPIALDAAAQRTGRAGRLFPGKCLRLWSQQAVLETSTVPEIHREALVNVVLATAANGYRVSQLDFLDPPKSYAIQTAENELQEMGALAPDHRITDLGRRIFALPVDAFLSKLLVNARPTEVAQEMVDLVAALAVGRPLFAQGHPELHPDDDLRHAHCDATALILALRRGHPKQHHLRGQTLAEARKIATQLRRVLQVDQPNPSRGVNREELARLILKTHPTTAYVARQRKKQLVWANGQQELELGRESAIEPTARVIVVVDTIALTDKRRHTNQLITCAIPCTETTLLAAGIGQSRISKPTLKNRVLTTEVITSHAGLVLAKTQQQPRGELARQALLELALRGSFLPKVIHRSRDRVEAHNLYQRLQGGSEGVDFEQWLEQQIEAVGFASSDDLALLLEEDFLFPSLPEDQNQWLQRHFPTQVSVGDAKYRADYNPNKKLVTLTKTAGTRKDPPNSEFLPSWPGWKVIYKVHSRELVVR